MDSLTQPHTGASKEQGKKMGDRGRVFFEYRNTHTPLHHYLMSPTRLQEQPHRLSDNWSRRATRPKYSVTKRAVENTVGGEYMHVHRKRDNRHMRSNKLHRTHYRMKTG